MYLLILFYYFILELTIEKEKREVNSFLTAQKHLYEYLRKQHEKNLINDNLGNKITEK